MSIELEIKYEGFGGGPLVGAGPGARAPCPPPLKSGPAIVKDIFLDCVSGERYSRRVVVFLFFTIIFALVISVRT